MKHTIEYYDEEKTKKKLEYWINSNGESHRLDGPACIHYNKDGRVRSEYYYINGQSHRPNGPAVIWYYKNGNIESEYYWVNGESHRIEGPADIWYNKDGSVSSEHYYINGKTYEKEDWEKLPEVIEFLKNKAFDETLCEILGEE